MDIRDGGTFSHAWSLCVEEHFYLLLPFLLILLQMIKVFKWSYWIIILLFLFGIGIRFYIFQNWYLPVPEDQDPWWYWYKYIYYPTYSRLDSLLVGVSIAAIYQFSPKLWSKLSRYGNVFILVSLILLTGAYFICYDQMSFNASIWGFPMVALGYGFLLTGALCPTSFLYKWDSSLTTFIASISYALYLSHKGIIHICHIFLKDYELNPNLLLLVSLAVSIAVAYLLYRIIEKPFMQLRDRIVKTK
jgi:peptidoglycan/LPS O-acetylase OafA/YrhL